MRSLLTFSICIIVLVLVESATTDHYKTLVRRYLNPDTERSPQHLYRTSLAMQLILRLRKHTELSASSITLTRTLKKMLLPSLYKWEKVSRTMWCKVDEPLTAYETLGDPEKRKTYDQWLNSPRRGPSQTPPRQPPPRRPSNDNKDHFEKTETFTGPDGKTTTRTYRSSSNDPKVILSMCCTLLTNNRRQNRMKRP